MRALRTGKLSHIRWHPVPAIYRSIAVILLLAMLLVVKVHSQEIGLSESAVRLFEIYEMSRTLVEGWAFIRERLQTQSSGEVARSTYDHGAALARRGDYEQAAKWYEKATDMGFAPARTELG